MVVIDDLTKKILFFCLYLPKSTAYSIAKNVAQIYGIKNGKEFAKLHRKILYRIEKLVRDGLLLEEKYGRRPIKTYRIPMDRIFIYRSAILIELNNDFIAVDCPYSCNPCDWRKCRIINELRSKLEK